MYFKMRLSFNQRSNISKYVAGQKINNILTLLYSVCLLLVFIIPSAFVLYGIYGIVNAVNNNEDKYKILLYIGTVVFFQVVILFYYKIIYFIINKIRGIRYYIFNSGVKGYVVEWSNIKENIVGHYETEIDGKVYKFASHTIFDNRVLSFDKEEPVVIIPYYGKMVLFMSLSTLDSRYTKIKINELKEFANKFYDKDLSDDDVNMYFKNKGINIKDDFVTPLDKYERLAYVKMIYKHFYLNHDGRKLGQEIIYRAKKMFKDFIKKTRIVAAIVALTFAAFVFPAVGKNVFNVVLEFFTILFLILIAIVLLYCIYKHYIINDYCKKIIESNKCNVYTGEIIKVNDDYLISTGVGKYFYKYRDMKNVYVFPEVEEGEVDILELDNKVIVMPLQSV